MELGARMAPFAGWEMPIQYEGIIAEHQQTRHQCSIFDTCHMGEFEIQGPSAEQDLERLVTASISTLKVEQCRYGYLLQDDGGILDDLTVYRRSPNAFWVIVNAGTRQTDADWIRNRLSADTTFIDHSPNTAKLDVQGPTSRETLEKAFRAEIPKLSYFRFSEMEREGTPYLISRTGYTGEWGYELYFPISETERTWDLIITKGGARPCGLGARDTLRLEVGYPLYGQELSPAQTPVAASRGMFVDTNKDFIGKEAVLKDLNQGTPRYLVGLQLESRRAARAHDSVYGNDRLVGEVTSGSLAPSLGVAVALAYVDKNVSEVGQSLDIDVRGKKLAAQVVELPFYKEGTARG